MRLSSRACPLWFVTDEYGCGLPHTDAAKRLAGRTLGEMMADRSDFVDAPQCRALVRDEAGTKLFTAHLTFAVSPVE